MNQFFKLRYLSFFLVLGILLGAMGTPIVAHAAGTVSLISDTAYAENFDTLASSSTSSTLPNGWYFSEADANGDTTYTAGTGSNNTGDTYSFGSEGSSDRAFGELTSNSLVTMIGANISNNSGTEILSLVISYTGEQWRKGSASADKMDFQYSIDATSLTTGTWTDVDSLDLISPVTSGLNNLALDGNASANRTAVSFTITGLNIANGTSFWIRWGAFNASGNDNGLAVDDFSLTPVLANRAPTDLALSSNTVAENQPTDAVMGTLSTTDPDTGNIFTYALASGTGDTDNASFNISGDGLRTSEVFDYETKNSYSVRIRTTDQGGLYFEKELTITIANVDDDFTDTTVAHFNAGTVGSCIVGAGIGNGALKLNLPSASCVFESRILDAGTLVDWTTLAATVTTPVGTSVTFDARTGNSASPDNTWTNWQVANGTLTNPGSQYIQYRATLSTTDSGQTPVLEEVTINFTTGSISSLISPDGSLSTWNGTFTWTGVNGATWYLLEVYTPGGTQMYRKWYTSTQTACASGTACSLTPVDLSLSNGDYQWRVMDYGAYGYGIWTYYKSFTLSTACYTLATDVDPADSGSVNLPAQSCPGGYITGTTVQLSAVAGTGYAFSSWSGDASGSTNPISVTMDGNKSVTANMRGNTPISPTGTLNNWGYAFSWTGLGNATWYLIEVQTSGGTQVFRQWYTSAQTNCAGGTGCSVTPSGLSLANGDYKWRVMDYGAYGYGLNSAFKTFTLNGVACYTLTTNVAPALSGNVTVPGQTCAGGYTAGSVIQLIAAPNSGYLFKDWSGDASGSVNPVSITMNGNKNVTANFKSTVVLGSPSGTLGSWNNTYSWTGLSNATWYLLEVYTPGGTQVFRKWYTSSQTNCSGGMACSISPPETAGLSGSYKWRMLDYGAYGYGIWTPYLNFTIP